MSGVVPAEGFFASVYDELRRVAAARLRGEAVGHTLEATALVHEVYMRMGGANFADRAGFFRAAAVAMQRVLVDHARAKHAAKRGGVGRRLAIDGRDPFVIPDPDTLLDVAAALDHLAAEDADAAEVARLRLFGGMTVEQVAEGLGKSRAAAFRGWAYARAWLSDALKAGTNPGEPS